MQLKEFIDFVLDEQWLESGTPNVDVSTRLSSYAKIIDYARNLQNMKPTNHGGKRPGAGRKKENNVIYYRRVNPEFVEKLDECLSKLKEETKKKTS